MRVHTATHTEVSLPTRFDLTEIYTGIHRDLTEIGANPRELVDEKRRVRSLPPEQEEILNKHLGRFNIQEQTHLRVLNDQNRYYLGDDLLSVALAINDILPRMSELEQREQQTYREVEKFPANTVMSAADLVYNHLAKEDPAYIRRLFSGSLNAREYYMNHTPLTDDVKENLQQETADWLLGRESGNKDILRILSMIGKDGKPCEFRDVKDPRVKFLSEMVGFLVPLSEFKRSDDAPFSRFVVLLPSVIFWTLGTSSNGFDALSSMEEDRLNDLVENTKVFTRALQAHADKASRLRQMLHYGFPVYTELLELAFSQNNLMSWSFEALVQSLSYNLPAMLKNRNASSEIIRFLAASGVLLNYAKHKDAYLQRATR